MKWFRRSNQSPRQSEGLTEERAIRIMHEVGNHALADEMERGRQRREDAAAEPAPLHAHEVSPDDSAFIRMITGARCVISTGLTLPSGRYVTGEELYKWVGAPEDGIE